MAASRAAPVGDAAWRAARRARRLRDWLVQGALVVALVALALAVARNVGANLDARGIKSGFGFLADPAGFNIGELLIDYTAQDSYLRAFMAGMANTLRVALAGIVLSSLLGVAVGLLRLAHHPLVRGLTGAYVEVFRNVPLVIQLLAIYLLVTELLPDSSGAAGCAPRRIADRRGVRSRHVRGRCASGSAARTSGRPWSRGC